MRRRLILVFVAISTMVAVAFVVPLGFLVRRTAEDRAMDAARADAAAVVPALVADGTRPQIESAIGATTAGREGRMTVMTYQGWSIGIPAESTRVEQALASGVSATGEVEGGMEVVAAVASGPGELSAIRVVVADGDLHRGQWRAWGALAAVGIALVGIAVIVADQLARTIVRPTVELAAAARRLGAGDLDATVEPDGPVELVELGGAFNELGSQVGSMLGRERELVAELSHRLRTPLTKLRLRLDHVDDAELAGRLQGDVDDVTVVVSDLIEEARGAGPDHLRGCDAGVVATERADFWSVLAYDQERPWRFERGRGPLPVAVSGPELAAAIDVLLENVFAHTEDGVALTVGFGEVSGMARVWVEDQGGGLPPGVLERGVSSGGSTGLGLDIARRTTEAANGHLDIGAGGSGGTAVAICLPIVSLSGQ